MTKMLFEYDDRLAAVVQQNPINCGRFRRDTTSGVMNDGKSAGRGVKATAVKMLIVLIAANFLLLVDAIEWL